MALVKQCDACGRVYIRNNRFPCNKQGGNVSGIATVNSAGAKDTKFDLCDDCLERLWEWLDISRSEPVTMANAVLMKDSARPGNTSKEIDTDI